MPPRQMDCRVEPGNDDENVRRLMRSYAALALVLVLVCTAAHAQSVQHIQRGDPLRKEVLDTVRPVFMGESSGRIEFVVNRLTIWGEWVFGNVSLQRPGGRKIDWRKSIYAEDFEAGFLDPGTSFFLLLRVGDRWAIVDWATGPTDVAWDWWRQQYGLPEVLFYE